MDAHKKRTRPQRDNRRPRPDFRGSADAEGPLRLFGVHAVEAALSNPKRVIKRLLATENASHKLADVIAKRGVVPEEASPRDLDRLLGEETVHQGLMLETEPLPEPTLAELAEAGVAGGPLIVLDHVTDPHNVGAILRSAAAFGASGLVMTRRHSPPLNGTLAKSASGALELVPVLLVQNLARALEELKQQKFLLLGLEGTAENVIENEPLTGRVAIVLGAEGKGLRQLTAQTCDRLVRIATVDRLASLNVSNAAAVALHLAAMRRAAS
jgi:23S rRNA (guanosine2251-2'-O)-methyltransferase